MILEQILENTRREVDARRAAANIEFLREAIAAQPPVRSLEAALRKPEVAVIAEFKRRSPSKGDIAAGANPAAVALAYQAHGASAISVLTDERYFGGSLDDLRAVRAAVDLPILRKDFIVDEFQLLEARAAGADAVLLIVAALGAGRLGELLEATKEHGLEALVEVHNLDETDIAKSVGARLIGINNRNLSTFVTDLDVTRTVASQIGGDAVIVSESGIRHAADVAQVREWGAHAVLVGESLMKSDDVGSHLRTLVSP